MSHRPVGRYILLLGGTIALGLATRRFPSVFPNLISQFGGDTLWAAMVFWLLALWRRRAATTSLAAGALSFAIAVELSQLYRAPWIDAVRATRGGALVLGQGFLWSDLACYGAGVMVAAVIDVAVQKRTTPLSVTVDR